MSQENVEVVRTAADAFAAGDIDRVEKHYTEDASITAWKWEDAVAASA
jgi:hypothetical protein